MLRSTICSLAGLFILSFSAQPSSIKVDHSCGGTPQVGPLFSFAVAAPDNSGNSSQCFNPTLSFIILDLSFVPPPVWSEADSCSSPVFSFCKAIADSSGLTYIHFEAGQLPGLLAGEDFAIVLTGFRAGAQITAVANAPEPASVSLCLAAALTMMASRKWLRRVSLF